MLCGRLHARFKTAKCKITIPLLFFAATGPVSAVVGVIWLSARFKTRQIRIIRLLLLHGDEPSFPAATVRIKVQLA